MRARKALLALITRSHAFAVSAAKSYDGFTRPVRERLPSNDFRL
jgi:hypothetical protein